VYAVDDEELEQTIGRLLLDRHLTIAVAESCTGGLIADRITDIPGSSAYFERSYVTYSNASKLTELGIPADVLRDHGA